MKIIHKLVDFFRILKFLGIIESIKYFKLKGKKNEVFNVRVKNYIDSFTLRGDTSDSWVFEMNIIREEYGFFKPNKQIKTILDAGANIGTASRYFNKCYPNAEIVAIEPSFDNFKILLRNTKKISGIRVKFWMLNSAFLE